MNDLTDNVKISMQYYEAKDKVELVFIKGSKILKAEAIHCGRGDPPVTNAIFSISEILKILEIEE